MDSGNSSSLQSSSGGDDEYDSRAESISAFFNNPSTHITTIPNTPPPQQPPQPPPPQSMFDPLSNYFDPLSQSSQSFTNNTPLLNLDMSWSQNLRSDPNSTDFSNFVPMMNTFPATQIPPAPETAAVNTIKNPKKRSRASRRAPTTVLTTDTSNFRAMVQEFTGIPAPPFTSSSFPRTRFDLFCPSSSLRSSSHLRPYGQKFQHLQRPISSFDVIGSTSNISSDLNLLKQPQSLLNMNLQNPVLNFQSLLQNQPRFPQQPSSDNQNLKMGVLEDFGLGHGHVNTQLGSLTNILSNSSDRTLLKNNDSLPNWSDGTRPNDGSIGKVSLLAGSSSDFQGEKGSENVTTTTTRNEGMVESWICSSD